MFLTPTNHPFGGISVGWLVVIHHCGARNSETTSGDDPTSGTCGSYFSLTTIVTDIIICMHERNSLLVCDSLWTFPYISFVVNSALVDCAPLAKTHVYLTMELCQHYINWNIRYILRYFQSDYKGIRLFRFIWISTMHRNLQLIFPIKWNKTSSEGSWDA